MVEIEGEVGGGSLPLRKLPGAGVAIVAEDAAALLAALRSGSPPVIALLREGRVVLDVRCVGDLAELASAVASAAARAGGQEIAKLGAATVGSLLPTQLTAGARGDADPLDEEES